MRPDARQSARFDDLCTVLRHLGFTERTSGGSHRIFTRPGIREIINVQPRNDGTAKPYQVRQVAALILKYRLAEPSDPERR